MPVAALLIYAGLGSPGLPDQPFAERASGGTRTAAGDAAAMSMQEALAKLRAHLQSPPRRSDRLAVAGALRSGARAVSRGRRGLWPRRRTVVANRPDIACRLGRGTGHGGRLGHAGSGQGVRGRIRRTRRARRNRAIISRSRSWSRATRGAHCRTGPISPPTCRPTPNGRSCCASASPRSRRRRASTPPRSCRPPRRLTGCGTAPVAARRRRACRPRKPSRRPRRRHREPLPRSAAQ